jgi:two-component system chemotaxis response regulator CheB
MPPVFTRMFAESLNRLSELNVTEAKDGDILEANHVYIAPGDFHTTVERNGASLVLRCRRGEKVSGHRPSVDVLFKSVAAVVGSQATGCLMTGMGRDGADGMLEMRKAGARCIAQDEESSVVFGMPKEAWENGAAESLVPEDRIAETILSLLRTRAEVRSTS